MRRITMKIAATAAAGIVGAAAFLGGTASAASYSGDIPFPGAGTSNTMSGGDVLSGTSANGAAGYSLAMQKDGNLVFYHGGAPCWASNTEKYPGAYVSYQNDGNFVVYASVHGTPVWASNTSQRGSAYTVSLNHEVTQGVSQVIFFVGTVRIAAC